MSTDPTTNLLGRTIGARYRKRRIAWRTGCAPMARASRRADQRMTTTPCPGSVSTVPTPSSVQARIWIRLPSPIRRPAARPRRAGRPRSRSPAVARCVVEERLLQVDPAVERIDVVQAEAADRRGCADRRSRPRAGSPVSSQRASQSVTAARRSSSRGGPSPGRPARRRRAARRSATAGPAPSRRSRAGRRRARRPAVGRPLDACRPSRPRARPVGSTAAARPGRSRERRPLAGRRIDDERGLDALGRRGALVAPASTTGCRRAASPIHEPKTDRVVRRDRPVRPARRPARRRCPGPTDPSAGRAVNANQSPLGE